VRQATKDPPDVRPDRPAPSPAGAVRAVLLALLAFLAAPAGGRAATVSVSPPPPSSAAVGTVWTVTVTVARNAGEPAQAPTITVVNGTTGARKSVAAISTGTLDAYRASVRFDSRGTWSYEIAYGATSTRFPDAISIGGKTRSGGSSGWKLLAVAAAAVALAALAALALLLRRRRPPRAEAAPAPARGSGSPSPDLVHDRSSLIGSCLYLYDVLGDEVLRARLRDALAEAGVSELDSVGARFDPSQHRATGWVPTDDPALEGRIAEVERRGFSDRGAVLRLPEVRVYSTDGGRGR
jgi:molecular chaperone GrpE